MSRPEKHPLMPVVPVLQGACPMPYFPRFTPLASPRCSHPRRWLPIAAGILFFLTLATDLNGQESKANSEDFNTLLRARTKITLAGDGAAPGAREFAENLAASHGIILFLDRRVDPDAPLELQLPEMPLEFALREAALRMQMGLIVEDNFIYVGPRTLCRWRHGALQRVQSQVERLPAAERDFWRESSVLTWEEGATPRELAAQIAGDKLSDAQLAKIPHDVWPAFKGPSLPRWKQLALVAAGFDLVPEFTSSGELSLEPLREVKPQTAQLNVPAAAQTQLIEHIQRYFPDVKATPRQNKLQVEGASGEIAAIKAWIAPPPARRPRGKAAGPVMALSTPIPVPADKLLQRLALELKCELVLSPDLPPGAVSKPIHPSWKGTRDELLDKISEALGLNCEFRDGKVYVTNN